VQSVWRHDPVPGTVTGILVGLAVATVLVIGWACGILVVVVLLALGDVFLMLLTMSADQTAWVYYLALMAIIWAPYTIRHLWPVVRPSCTRNDPATGNSALATT
jgi:hypothetical protein